MVIGIVPFAGILPLELQQLISAHRFETLRVHNLGAMAATSLLLLVLCVAKPGYGCPKD